MKSVTEVTEEPEVSPATGFTGLNKSVTLGKLVAASTIAVIARDRRDRA